MIIIANFHTFCNPLCVCNKCCCIDIILTSHCEQILVFILQNFSRPTRFAHLCTFDTAENGPCEARTARLSASSIPAGEVFEKCIGQKIFEEIQDNDGEPLAVKDLGDTLDEDDATILEAVEDSGGVLEIEMKRKKEQVKIKE